MKNKKLFFTIISVFFAFVNVAYSASLYGSELMLDTGFENLSVGTVLVGNTWRPYYSADTAYVETISTEKYSNFVYSGKKAIRFTNAGGGNGRGVYYNNTLISGAKPGDVYEFTGYFKTDSPSGAKLYVRNQWEIFSGGEVTLGNEWQKVTASFIVPEGFSKLNLHIGTNLTMNLFGSSYESYEAYRDAVSKADGVYFVYADELSFRKVFTNISAVKTICSANGVAATVDSDNRLWMWGDNSYNQITENNQSTVDIPWQVADSVSDVAIGDGHVLILKTDGKLYAKGRNDFGQLGCGSFENSAQPVCIMEGISDIAAGDEFSVAVSNSGELYGWGRSKFHTYGVSGDSSVPVMVLKNVASVSASGAQTFAVLNTGVLQATGYNLNGQLGLGNYFTPYRFTKVMENVIDVSANDDYTLVLTKNGEVYGFGWNKYGYLGAAVENSNIPFKIYDNIISVSAGEKAAMLIDNEHNLIKLGGENSGFLNGAENTAEIIGNGITAVSGGEPLLAVSNGKLMGYENGFLDISLKCGENILTLEYGEESGNAFTVIVNGVDAAEEVLLIKSFYRGNKLKGVETEKVILGKNHEITVKPLSGTNKCKVMLWKNMELLIPKTEPASFITFMASAEQTGEDACKVIISGKAMPEDLICVTLIKKGGTAENLADVGYIGEAEADGDGAFSLEFNFGEDVSEYKAHLVVRDEYIESEIYMQQ